MGRLALLCWVGLLFVGLALPVLAEETAPLHVRIDEAIAKRQTHAVAAQSSDAEFVRRVYLDLAGTIPTVAETREFLASTAPDKRTVLIDKLLNAPTYARRMSGAFDVMLMERLGSHAEWQKFLRASFTAKKSYRQLVQEIVAPTTEDQALRGAAFFYTQRLENIGQNPVDLPGLTRDLGRLFWGIDLQCAQCHDHPTIPGYHQVDYQGLFAFVGQLSIRKDVPFPAVAEAPFTKKVDFMSVFVQEPKTTGLRLPFRDELMLPEVAKGEEFVQPPDKKTKFPGVPKQRPLVALATELTQPTNDHFARNAVNRLWWLLLGRGIVHPLDQTHAANPPSHPELLDLLAAEFVAHDYDISYLMREITLSSTYQRSSQLPSPGSLPPPESFAVALEKPISSEQLLWSMLTATGELARLAPADDLAPNKEWEALRKRYDAAFANPPREPEVEIAPSVKAALFLMHDAELLRWLEPRDGNLLDRLAKLAPEAAAEELYLTVLSRHPTVDERAVFQAYLSSGKYAPNVALSHCAWALVTSAEFCLNH